MAAPTNGHPRRTGSEPPSAGGRRLVAAVSGGLLVALAAGCFWYKADYDFSAGFPQDTESARAAADLQRGFAAGALAPTEVYLTTDRRLALTDQQIQSFAAAAADAPGVGQAQPPERGTDPSVARVRPPARREPGLQRGDRARA